MREPQDWTNAVLKTEGAPMAALLRSGVSLSEALPFSGASELGTFDILPRKNCPEAPIVLLLEARSLAHAPGVLAAERIAGLLFP